MSFKGGSGMVSQEKSSALYPLYPATMPAETDPLNSQAGSYNGNVSRLPYPPPPLYDNGFALNNSPFVPPVPPPPYTPYPLPQGHPHQTAFPFSDPTTGFSQTPFQHPQTPYSYTQTPYPASQMQYAAPVDHCCPTLNPYSPQPSQTSIYPPIQDSAYPLPQTPHPPSVSPFSPQDPFLNNPYQQSPPSEPSQPCPGSLSPSSASLAGSTVAYAPSCPPASDIPDDKSTAPEMPLRRNSAKRAPSIGFEEDGSYQHRSLYPSFSNTSSTTGSLHRRLETLSSITTPLPPDLTLLWQSSRSVKIFFIQNEGHVVSPEKSFNFLAYKGPRMSDVSSFPVGSLAGKALDSTLLLQVEDTWRLGLAKQRSFIVRGLQGEFGFYDDSTSPARYVVIVLPKESNKEERQRLDVLLSASSSMTDEPSNIVDKLESGVESVFDILTQTVGSAVKKGTPDLHKNTKWLRKGTGNVVRFGGNLVSKGVHLVSDTVMTKDVPKEASSKHREVFEALKTYRQSLESNKITKISPANKK